MSPAGVEVLAGAGLDLAFGDPHWLPHPVRAIGWGIRRLEGALRKAPLSLRAAGVLLCLATVGVTAAFVWGTMKFLPSPFVGIYWVYSFLAVRDLDVHACRVMAAVASGDLVQARERLSWIVGRDTAALNEPQIIRATVETVSENLCDGIVAPLFYLLLGGPVAMAAYKAINTLDSMVGYKDERYRDLGWFSARTDDWANWIPARLTALLVVFVALLPGLSARGALQIALRDGASQPSPNSGFPEAAAAGAIGVRLGGLNFYRGVESRKAFLGDATRPLDQRAFSQVRLLLYAVSFLSVVGVWLRWR